MKTSRILVFVALAASAVTFDTARATEHPTKTEHPATTENTAAALSPMGSGDIVSVAAATDNLKMFVAAVKAAGLVEKFQGKGPFTVFAPTDEAFAQLPAGTMDDLMKPANQAQLAGILANHVVPGVIMAADVKTMKATNVNGQDLDVVVTGKSVMVSGAKVVKADLVAGNGVIHIIDKVLLPAAKAEKPAGDKPKDHPAH